MIDGKYRLVRLLGQGGMGEVYEAHHEVVGRRHAVKCLRAGQIDNQEMVARFLREARAAAAIGSDHIVYIFDAGQAGDGTPYIVMEFLEGESLGDYLGREGPLPPSHAVSLMLQLCEAVGAAHEAGIIHRDLKPENIFVTPRPDGTEWIKVLDFGIAKFRAAAGGLTALTRSGTTMGTPYYMAPEQLRESKDVDERADVYAAGVLLYQMLAGAVPFNAESFGDLVIKVATTEPKPLTACRPDVDPALEAVVRRAMSRQVEDRFASMGELARAVAPFASAPDMVLPKTAVNVGAPPPATAGAPTAGELASAPRAQPAVGPSAAQPLWAPTESAEPIAAEPRTGPSTGRLAAIVGAGTVAILVIGALIGVLTWVVLRGREEPEGTGPPAPAPSAPAGPQVARALQPVPEGSGPAAPTPPGPAGPEVTKAVEAAPPPPGPEGSGPATPTPSEPAGREVAKAVLPARGPEPAREPVPVPEPAAPPPSFVGRWRGVGQQDPPGIDGATWTVTAEITTTAAGRCGTVQYPSLGCGGVWICEPGFDGRTLRARERITFGSRCVDGGVMRMTLTRRGRLSWRHSAAGIDAWATMSRGR